MDVSAKKKKVLDPTKEKKKAHLRSLISLKNYTRGEKGFSRVEIRVEHESSFGVWRCVPVCGYNHPAGLSSCPRPSCRDPYTVSLAFG